MIAITVETFKKRIKFLQLVYGLGRHKMRNECCVVGAYAELSKEGVEEMMSAANEQEKIKIEEILHFLEVVISSSGKLNSQIDFLKEYEEIGCDVSWQSLGEIYDCCKKSLFATKTVLNKDMGKIKIYASLLVFKVLENLIDNTLQHGKASEIRLSFFIAPNENLVIVYEDNGIGIPQSDKDRIFEKGYGKNTGMGLYLSKEVLDITDTKICEKGEPGKGVRFEIIVPKDNYKI